MRNLRLFTGAKKAEANQQRARELEERRQALYDALEQLLFKICPPLPAEHPVHAREPDLRDRSRLRDTSDS